MTVSAETQRWIELDRRHHLHPFTTFKELAAKGSRVIVRGEGCYLWDSEGNRLLDAMSGLWCINVGYGRERLARAAYEQMQRLPFYNSFFQCSTPPAIELAAKLAEILPRGLDKIFFVSSGSEANDTIVKSVWYYWNLQGRPRRKHFISRKLGYHGIGLGSASLTGMTFMHRPFDLPLPRFSHIGNPYWFAEGDDMDPEAFGLKAAGELEERILDIGPDNVAAFVAEPIQGAGGVIIPPASYWPEIQRICRKYDVLLVVDEVICGFGRTGSWWGSQTFGIEPDAIAMAKGLTSGYQPLAAVAFGRRLGDALYRSDFEYAHGVTYAGHPTACAVALENIAIIEEEGLATRASGPIGDYFAKGLRTLTDHPLVGEVRAKGLLAAIEIVEDKATRKLFEPQGRLGLTMRDLAIRNGIVMRAVRDALVLAPPLVITEEQVDEIVEKARRTLDDTLAFLGRRA